MRPSPLYNLKQGINRLRIKGGANPSSLFDLLNGWITVDGSVNPREGTIRAATLNGNTKGLMADNGIFNVFSITQQAVPSGYVDNLLVNPNDASQALVTIWFAKPFMGFPYVVAQFANGDIFHYWLQNAGNWAPNTVYTNSTLILPLTAQTGLAYLAQRVSAVNPAWQPETGIALNAVIEPTEYTGFQYKAVAVAGASPHTGQSEPVWPIVSAGTIQEFGDFDTSSTDAGTTQGTTPSTAQPLSTTITDRYGDSSTIANAGSSAGNTLTLPTAASTIVTTWKKGTLYAPGAVVQPSTSQGAFLNAIPNGDFENGNDGNWVLSAGVSFNVVNEYQGTECLQFTAAHSDETAVMSTFGLVTPGQSVKATAYFNPNNSGANLSMGINLRWYDASDTFLSMTSGPREENGGYRLSTVTGIAPAGAVHVRVQLDGGNNTTAKTGFADLVSWNLATPTAVSNFLFEAVQSTTGTSASTEPVWPTISGNTVIDNTVTWKAIGTSIITWEAIPIMLSGAVEPVWPTTVPTAVLDASTFKDLNGVNVITSISWIANSRRITDPKCPNTNAAALNSSHVFAVDKDIVPFSAAVDPTDWSSVSNAGYIPTGLNNYGDNPAAVLALYRSNLMAFNAGGYQMWQTDPDPANMAILDAQPVGSIYTRAAQSVANDLLFLTEVGVRNLATVGATANMQVGSSGQPVDPLVLSQLKGTPLYLPAGGADNFASLVSLLMHFDFTPTPFPSSLLLHFDGANGSTAFPDSSSVGNAVSVVTAFPGGTAALTTTNPEFGTASVLMAGNGVNNDSKYLSTPVTAGGPLDLTAGDFTVEFWLNTTANFCSLLDASYSFANGWQLEVDNAGAGFNLGARFGTQTMQAGIAFPVGSWVPVAFARQGNTFGLWQGGASVQTAPLAGNLGASATSLLIGALAVGTTNRFQNFQMDELRITKGVALYTPGVNYTPSVVALGPTPSFSVPTILDSSVVANAITVAACALTAISPEFGTGSLGGLGSSANHVTTPITANGPLDLSVGDFTIELGLFPLAVVGANQPTIVTQLDGATGLALTLASMQPNFVFGAGGAITATNQLPLNVWSQLALVRKGNIFGLFVNGTSAGTATLAGGIGTGVSLFIGAGPSTIYGLGYNGRIDEVRITKAARYTPGVNYVPATAAFPNPMPIYTPLSLYYPGKGQYWLFFGPQAFVFTVNGQGLRTWSRYIFPDVITDWTLNGGILYLRTAGNLVWQFDSNTLVDDFGGANVLFPGVIQTPYVDVGPFGLDKELIGVDIVGTGACTLQVGWAQNDPTTFSDNPNFATSLNVTPPFAVSAADTVPGEPIPMPMTAPSFTLILTFAGNQAWDWQASNLYISDVAGTPTG